MKKKFDFSAEMSEVESIKTTPKNEYLEEEKRHSCKYPWLIFVV